MNNKVGLGTFPLAGVFSKVLDEDAINIVKTFINNGGYYIDTAPLYGFGEVERLLGKIFKSFSRDKFYIITKCGYVDVEGKTFQTVQKSGRFKDIIRECDRSLKRLSLNYIDLYFIHSPDPNTPFEETIGALIKLQEEGKIRKIGVSNVSLKELKEYNKTGKVKYIQNRFSLINRSVNEEFEGYLRRQGIGLIPYQPIERGQLSDRATKRFQLREGDLRLGRSDWQSEQFKFITSWVRENLYPVAKKLGIRVEQLAVSWILHQNFVDFVIVGATNTNQVLINLKADGIKLSTANLKEIESAYKKLDKKVKDKFGQTLREFRGLNEKFY